MNIVDPFDGFYNDEKPDVYLLHEQVTYSPILLIKYKSRPVWDRETLSPERLPKENAVAYELGEILYSCINVLK